jgi:Na+-driven multidrug efflux pump
VLAVLPLILKVYGLSADASYWTNRLVWSHGIMMVIIWPLAYTLPVTFRAAGDARFPMLVSMLSMLLCRIALSYVFGVWFKMGMYGTWIAMFVDWIVKAGIFAWRYGSGKWIRYSTVGVG